MRHRTARKRTLAKNPPHPKQRELEHRIRRLGARMNQLADAVDLLTKRCTAIQAQLDHVIARFGR